MLHKQLKFIIFSFLLLVKALPLHAYTISPTCPNFTDINASSVVATTGTTDNPFANTGIVNARHTLISTTGTDSLTGNLLQLLPSGETQVVKLGNEEIGAEAEALTYHFMVDKLNSILQFKFAVVFEDPQHPFLDQPRFKVRVTDKDGNLLNGCSEYDVSSGENLAGFNTYQTGYSTIPWRDWTTMVLDLSSYAGKEVQIQFVTYDCSQSGHFGYAYFTAHCMSNQLKIQSCTGSSFTAVAPSGFASYLWDNGDKTAATTRIFSGTDCKLACKVTSDIGCSYVMNAFVSSNSPIHANTTYNDTICEGELYFKNDFAIPFPLESGNQTFYNAYFDISTCKDDIVATLNLNVKPRYRKLKEHICHGEDYKLNGFNITAPIPGIYFDTLQISRANLCDSIVTLVLKVDTVFTMASSIIGDTNPCIGKEINYSFIGGSVNDSYSWEVPSSASIISGQNTNSISVIFHQSSNGVLKLLGGNGCSTGSYSLNINPNPTYYILLHDTICTGDIYAKNGFVLTSQDSIGRFLYINKMKSTMGCDSTTILKLDVQPTPTIKVVLQGDSVLCSGEEVTLHAIDSNGELTFDNRPLIAVGDIFCTDGSIIKPDKYIASGKTAKAVVFFVDQTGYHGWAYNYKQSYYEYWNTVDVDIPTIVNITPFSSSVYDFDGYGNTKKIRDFGDASMFPAVYAIDFANGFYIPAQGQLVMYLTNLNETLPTLSILGYPTFRGTYTSSTEANLSYCYAVQTYGSISHGQSS